MEQYQCEYHCKLNFFLHCTEMCTGTFFEEASASGNNKDSPEPGTRCEGPCIYEEGRWGSSYCNTENDNWGAECIQCPGKE